MTFVRAEFDTQDTNATHFCKLSLNAQVSGLPANTVALGDTVSDLLCAGTQLPGFSDLIEAESEAQEQTQLAKLPADLAHVDLENFRDRPVQEEILELLLLPVEDRRFSTCVLIHGMGGTGKVSGLMVFSFVQIDDWR